VVWQRLDFGELAQRSGEQIAIAPGVSLGFAFKAQAQHRLGIAGPQQPPAAFKADADAIDRNDFPFTRQRGGDAFDDFRFGFVGNADGIPAC